MHKNARLCRNRNRRSRAFPLRLRSPRESSPRRTTRSADRYKQGKEHESFRQYNDSTPPVVREFYRLNHANQTREFVLSKKQQYGALNRGEMGIWEAMDFLNTLVDDSDPDTDLSQIEHN